MEMTETQFNRFIEQISRNQEDHDLLIEIRALLTSSTDETGRVRARCREDMGSFKAATSKAHERIDKIYVHLGIPLLCSVLLTIAAVLLRL